METTSRDSLLGQLTATIEKREDNYDNPLPNFLRIGILWSVWFGRAFDPLDVIFMMDLMKTAREIHNHSDDTLLDKTGYTISCYERIDSAMRELGYEAGIEHFRTVKNMLGMRFSQGDYVGYLFDLLLRYKNRDNEILSTDS